MEMKVGIITFQRVYNYGAVIQAYCLQSFIESNGYDAEVIDFSKLKQLDYTDILSKHNGSKRFIKSLLLAPFNKKRKKRKKRFDDFINFEIKKTSKIYRTEKELEEIKDGYDVFVAGSDQIWNPLKLSDFSEAYLLAFTNRKKIAYAPSIGKAKATDLIPYKHYLEKFSAISCREKSGAEILGGILQKQIINVIDPTLIIDKEELKKKCTKVSSKPYLLYYSLDGASEKNNNIQIIKRIGKKYGLIVKAITPEWPCFDLDIENVMDAGPIEFLSLINNAELICTNSFHGTALSIAFEKPFYVIEKEDVLDDRKRALLNLLEIHNRTISRCSQIEESHYEMDYSDIRLRLNIEKEKSAAYLLSSLKDKIN